jgi:hypothetical protein
MAQTTVHVSVRGISTAVGWVAGRALTIDRAGAPGGHGLTANAVSIATHAKVADIPGTGPS